MSSNNAACVPGGQHVRVELEGRIAWVILNRPEKRNALSPALNREMFQVLDALETDERCGIVILTGEGDAFTAGMDLKEYFRETDRLSPIQIARTQKEAMAWMWRKLMYYPKPTIAMVNGWCFGGGFTPLISCDLAIADEEAIFGLSEINWGIIPGGNVTRALSAVIGQRDALYFIMTGETFNGRRAAEMRLVNEAVPKSQLRERTRQVAEVLLAKNPTVLAAAKRAFKFCKDMSWEESEEYLVAKQYEAMYLDPEKGRVKGMEQFLDKKAYKPGLGAYERKE